MPRRRAPEQPPTPTPSKDPWTEPRVLAEVERRGRRSNLDAENLDAYRNELTGIGDYLRDKTFGGRQGGPDFLIKFISAVECENRWRGSDLGGRIVETIPDEMTREGWDINLQPSDGDADEDDQLKTDDFPDQGMQLAAKPPAGPLPEIDDESADTVEAIEGALEEIGASDAFWEVLCYERAYGGGAILVGADDGHAELAEPLDEQRIKSIKWLNAFQGGREGEIVAWSYYTDPRSPKYGMPETYMIRNIGVPITTIPAPGQSPRIEVAPQYSGNLGYGPLIFWVHESRLLVFPGPAVSRRARVQMRGWGDPLFMRVDEVLSQYGQTWGGLANLMQDFSQGVLNIDGLKQALAGGNKASKGNPITTRALQLQMSRSLARILLLDKDEQFSREATPLSGIAEILQQFSMRLAAAADMPVTLLMGQAPAGLNATGASDIRFFYDRIAAKQKKRLGPQLKRLIRLLMLAKEGPTEGVEVERWNVEFKPLYQMTEIETATLRKTVAETDHIYIADQVLSPEEVTASAFGGSSWSAERVVDFEGRKKVFEEAQQKKVEQQAVMSESARLGVQPDKLALAHPENPQNLPQPDGPPKDGEAAKGKSPFDRGDEFSEEDHPRDKDGKFASGGGGGGSSAAKEGGGRGRALSGGELLKHAEATGGFTFNPATQAFPKEGFAVSVHPGHERVVKGKITGKDIKDYLRAKASFVKSNPGTHVGLWHDVEAGKWYLDVSHVEESRATAVKLAREHGQEGIYSLHEGKTIIVKKKSERRLL